MSGYYNVMTGKEDMVKVPLKWRMKAWWEGYDRDDIRKRLARGEEIDEADLERSAEKTKSSSGNPIGWDENRLESTQIIWGEGYCGPGGPEYVKSMSKLLCMNSNMSVAVIGADLGGPSRVLATKFGAWITGYEESKELAEKGMLHSVKAGLEGKAPIQVYDPKNADIFERTFDRAYSKEVLYTVEDKKSLLKNVFKNLKDGGFFLSMITHWKALKFWLILMFKNCYARNRFIPFRSQTKHWKGYY